MTFVLGGRCADGAVLAADRRILRGFELGEETEKLFPLGPLVVSFAGIQDFGLRLVEALRDKRSRPLPDLVALAKATLRELWDAHKEALHDDARVDALLAGLHEGRWHLYLVSCEGWAEATPLECLGDAGVYGRSLARTLWDASLPAEALWPLAVFLIAQTGRAHVSVGGNPDVLLLRDGGAIEKVGEERVRAVLERTDAVAASLRRTLREGLS